MPSPLDDKHLLLQVLYKKLSKLWSVFCLKRFPNRTGCYCTIAMHLDCADAEPHWNPHTWTWMDSRGWAEEMAWNLVIIIARLVVMWYSRAHLYASHQRLHGDLLKSMNLFQLSMCQCHLHQLFCQEHALQQTLHTVPMCITPARRCFGKGQDQRWWEFSSQDLLKQQWFPVSTSEQKMGCII